MGERQADHVAVERDRAVQVAHGQMGLEEARGHRHRRVAARHRVRGAARTGGISFSASAPWTRPEYGLVRPLICVLDGGAKTFGGPNRIEVSSRGAARAARPAAVRRLRGATPKSSVAAVQGRRRETVTTYRAGVERVASPMTTTSRRCSSTRDWTRRPPRPTSRLATTGDPRADRACHGARRDRRRDRRLIACSRPAVVRAAHADAAIPSDSPRSAPVGYTHPFAVLVPWTTGTGGEGAADVSRTRRAVWVALQPHP